MSTILNQTQVKRLAGLEINTLVMAQVLPKENLLNAQVKAGTPVLDLDGSILFYRMPVSKGRATIAFADVAANPVFGSPLLAFHLHMIWDPKDLIQKAEDAAKKQRGGRAFEYDKAEFVAFSYPKMAVRFLKSKKEVAMISLYTWESVPSEERDAENPYNRRQSVITLIPAREQVNRTKFFMQRMEKWDQLIKPEVDVLKISPDLFGGIEITKPKSKELVIHYSTDLATHSPCFELTPQHTNVWCVAASTKMILDFYRFVYAQDRIAAEEGLGTHDHPNGLPYGDENKVVNTIEKLSSNGLDATVNMAPTWAEFRDEINANRPLISFIPGHSRAIAGYSETKFSTWYLSRFLRLYDPWTPHVGLISWENFDVQNYRVTFTIRPKTV